MELVLYDLCSLSILFSKIFAKDNLRSSKLQVAGSRGNR
jgi:hypothetical protein